MSKDRRYGKTLKSLMHTPASSEIFLSPQFLQYLNKESTKRGIDPMIFFTKNKKYIKSLGKKH